MLKKTMFLPAAALALTVGAATPSFAEDEGCDTAALAEAVKASGVTTAGAKGAVEVVMFYSENACAVGRQDVNMIRGMMSDAYGALEGDDQKAALAAAKSLTEAAAMECSDKDAKPIMVLQACTLDDVQKALGN